METSRRTKTNIGLGIAILVVIVIIYIIHTYAPKFSPLGTSSAVDTHSGSAIGTETKEGEEEESFFSSKLFLLLSFVVVGFVAFGIYYNFFRKKNQGSKNENQESNEGGTGVVKKEVKKIEKKLEKEGKDVMAQVKKGGSDVTLAEKHKPVIQELQKKQAETTAKE